MVGEGEDAPAHCSENIEVRGFGRECHGRGRQRGFAVEPGAAHAGAREKVRKWFQASSVTTEREAREYRSRAFPVNCQKRFSPANTFYDQAVPDKLGK